MKLLKPESSGGAPGCAALLMEVVPLVMRLVRAEMRAHRSDLSVPQFRALAFLRHRQGASLSDVAEHVGLTLSSASRLIEGLVARELVTRQESAEDRRYVVLALTPAGELLLGGAREATYARLAEVLEGLSAEEQATVCEALQLLRPLFERSRAQEQEG